jgi:hypothetical protein
VLHDQTLAHTRYQIADDLSGGVAEQTINHRLLGKIALLSVDGANIGNELRLKAPDGRKIR